MTRSDDSGTTDSNSETLARQRARSVEPGFGRQVAEFLVVLGLTILIFRTFAAEAYIVPTGSMAPTLLGMHREMTCPGCGFRYPLGTDEHGYGGRPICPNCGEPDQSAALSVDRDGDRLLVQKFFYDLRPPRRWEVVVFRSPTEPDQPYVKRVVGLPNESILIHDGDVFLDGRIARKSIDEQRAMRIMVFDSAYVPKDTERFPRWTFRRGRWSDPRPSGWRVEAGGFAHRTPSDGGDASSDWLLYRHWDPGHSGYGPVRDFYAYNGAEMRTDYRVGDLMLDARVKAGGQARTLLVRIGRGADQFVVELPVGGEGKVAVRRNGTSLKLADVQPARITAGRSAHLEVSLMDRRLTAAVDGRLLFTPYDYDDPSGAYSGPPGNVLGLGVLGAGAEVERIQVYRDVFYTPTLAQGPIKPHAVDAPYRLGPGQYFVLGDNSPVSNDSRFWTTGPVVRREMLVGKPFLVHLPSQAIPLKVFGRTTCWIPDPWEIRYIR